MEYYFSSTLEIISYQKKVIQLYSNHNKKPQIVCSQTPCGNY